VFPPLAINNGGKRKLGGQNEESANPGSRSPMFFGNGLLVVALKSEIPIPVLGFPSYFNGPDLQLLHFYEEANVASSTREELHVLTCPVAKSAARHIHQSYLSIKSVSAGKLVIHGRMRSAPSKPRTSNTGSQFILPNPGSATHGTFTYDWRPDLDNQQRSANLEESLVLFPLTNGPWQQACSGLLLLPSSVGNDNLIIDKID
jgi:hypothetical protein